MKGNRVNIYLSDKKQIDIVVKEYLDNHFDAQQLVKNLVYMVATGQIDSSVPFYFNNLVTKGTQNEPIVTKSNINERKETIGKESEPKETKVNENELLETNEEFNFDFDDEEIVEEVIEIKETSLERASRIKRLNNIK